MPKGADTERRTGDDRRIMIDQRSERQRRSGSERRDEADASPNGSEPAAAW